MANDQKPVISVRKLRKVYMMGQEHVVALHNIDLDIPRGEVCCIFGTSGSGKSTLLNQLAGLEKPTRGVVRIGGVPISQLNENQLAAFRQKHIGFVFQSYNLLPELTHFPVILLQAGANRRASSQIARWLMGLGWTKDALRFADTIEDQLMMINLNQGISFMPQGSYPVGIRLIPIVSDTPILHHTEAVMRQMTPLHLQFVEQLRQADVAERHP